MKKLILSTAILVLVGNSISLFFRHPALTVGQPLVWVLGSIWFVLFLVYGLVPVVVALVKEVNHD